MNALYSRALPRDFIDIDAALHGGTVRHRRRSCGSPRGPTSGSTGSCLRRGPRHSSHTWMEDDFAEYASSRSTRRGSRNGRLAPGPARRPLDCCDATEEVWPRACVRIEGDRARDRPGQCSTEAEVSAPPLFLITHEEVDHIDGEKLGGALARQPGADRLHAYRVGDDAAMKIVAAGDFHRGRVRRTSGRRRTRRDHRRSARVSQPGLHRRRRLPLRRLLRPRRSGETLLVPASGPWLKLGKPSSSSARCDRAFYPRRQPQRHRPAR